MRHYGSLAAVPEWLATRVELRSWGLVPGGRAEATVMIQARISGRRRLERLYRVDQATAPAPPAGEQAVPSQAIRSMAAGRAGRPGQSSRPIRASSE